MGERIRIVSYDGTSNSLKIMAGDVEIEGAVSIIFDEISPDQILRAIITFEMVDFGEKQNV